MIKITNISGGTKGKQKYHLFVNGGNGLKAVNLTFYHDYDDGLAQCLRKAAEKVEGGE
jgi:hypothetical protein